MKKVNLKIVIFIGFSFSMLVISCKKDIEENFGKQKEIVSTVNYGKEIFETTGNCVACHQPTQKIIGPSLQEIAKIYKEKKASIVLFLKQESDPIVDPSQYEVMKTNFAITKSMNDDDLKALEDYIFSFSK